MPTLVAYEEKIDVGTDRACLLRHGTLRSACHWLFFLGSQKYDLFRKAMKGIHNLCIHLKGYTATEDNVFSTKGDRVIRDPVAVQTKGAPKARNCRGCKRWCTEYRNPGHTKRRCPGKKISRGMEMEDGYTAGFDSDALEEIKMFNHIEELGLITMMRLLNAKMKTRLAMSGFITWICWVLEQIIMCQHKLQRLMHSAMIMMRR
nr:uncharacterized protein LOC112789991 isoform X2 [Arachis hypogaea]